MMIKTAELEFDSNKVPVVNLQPLLDAKQVTDLSDDFLREGSAMGLFVPAKTLEFIGDYFARAAPNYERIIVNSTALYLAMTAAGVLREQADAAIGGILVNFAIVMEVKDFDIGNGGRMAVIALIYEGTKDRPNFIWGFLDDVRMLVPAIDTAFQRAKE